MATENDTTTPTSEVVAAADACLNAIHSAREKMNQLVDTFPFSSMQDRGTVPSETLEELANAASFLKQAVTLLDIAADREGIGEQVEINGQVINVDELEDAMTLHQAEAKLADAQDLSAGAIATVSQSDDCESCLTARTLLKFITERIDKAQILLDRQNMLTSNMIRALLKKENSNVEDDAS